MKKVKEPVVNVELTEAELTDILWYLEALTRKDSALIKKLETAIEKFPEMENKI
jgi:hypothetical protein